MPINQLKHAWFRQIRELHPQLRITQVRNFVWLMLGIYQSRSVYLSRIAGKVPGQAKLLSVVRRLSRFLDNPSVRVRQWYRPVAHEWLKAQLKNLGEIRLIVDGTKVGFAHQLLMVSLAYRRRSIPIAWTWIKHVRGHSSGAKQLALLSYVRKLIPQGARVILVGDTEFGSVKVLKKLDAWGWFYVLRQKTDTLVLAKGESDWKAFGSFIEKAGQKVWLENACYTASKKYTVNLLVYWKTGEKEPWCLATNLPDSKTALRYYKRRVWIEEMFGDMKKHGFDLENSMLRSFLRLSRLTLAVAFLYLWIISTGAHTIHVGKRHIVDVKSRRDLSLFQIGMRFIERAITNASPIHRFSLCFYR
jgi:hypothetical protein